MKKNSRQNKVLWMMNAVLVLMLLASCGTQGAGTPIATPSPTLSHTGGSIGADGSSTGPLLERPLGAKAFSLINDRLFIKAPTGTEDIAVQPDIMSAERSADEQTRLILDVNGQKLVIFAQEIFQYSANLAEDIDRIIKSTYGESYKYSLDTLDGHDGFEALMFSPDSIDTSAGAVLVRGAYARVADRTLISVGVYVTPDLAVDEARCIDLAERILASTQPGTRQIVAPAREEMISFDGLDFSIRLDKDFTLYVEHGVDFIVAYIMKITKVGQVRSNVGIYIGGHPSMHYPQRGIEERDLTKSGDTVLGQAVEWLSYNYRERLIAEMGFALPGGNHGLNMHIFMTAADEPTLAQLKAIIKTLKAK